LLVENGADISNQSLMTVGASGTLTTSADGAEDEIETSIFNSGTVDFVSDSTVLTQKKWVNDGTINIGTVGAASGAEIVVDAGDSLDVLDGGAINLDNAKDSIVAAGGGSQFWNRGNTIVGEGTIGDANLYIQNVLGATIDATGVLVLGNSTSAPTIGNGGLLEASNGGTLTIENNIDNTGDILVKAGGNLLASGQVQDTGRVDLDGGTAEFGSWVNNLIYFDAGVSSTLILDNPASNEDGGITGFAAGGANAIDFKNFKYGDGKFTNLGGGNAFDDWLELQNSLGQDSVGIGLDGNFTAAAGSFKFSEDKWGGTIVHWTPKA